MKFRFAFLVLEGHPYGREMLRILMDEGFAPAVVIEEVSPVADDERRKFLDRIAGQPVPPTFSHLLAGTGIPRQAIGNHNDRACQEILMDFTPALLVLGGTRILRPHILAMPPWGTVNAHPGLLPWLRGSSSVGWALYKDMRIGSTVHFVEADIDTGPIILRRELPVHRGETYERLVRRVLTLSGELMAEALSLIEAGLAEAMPQDTSVDETLRVIPPDLLAAGKARLAEGRYSHFVEGDRDDA